MLNSSQRPAQEHSLKRGIGKRQVLRLGLGEELEAEMEANVANYRRQLARLGLSHDRRRSVSTTDPQYYRWTQWIFSQIFNAWYDAEQERARPIDELVDECVDPLLGYFQADRLT